MTKLIAFYLPQYHPFPENDAWWGKGFTEWTNVTKAKPNFLGHEQPHLPADLGFYDLRLREARAAQAEMAKAYGIHGFCYYYYWFGGKRLLHRPLEAMLADGEPDLPFCLCWANENWTRRWDGAEHQVLMAQQHSAEDDIAFIHSMFPYFQDSRYIRIDGRPLLLIYRISLFPTPRETVERWRAEARKHGIGELHIAVVQSFDIQSPVEYGCDSAVEFPPHGMRWTPAHEQVQITSPEFQGRVSDYLDMVRGALEKPAVAYRRFRGVMPGFDNTARRQHAGDIFINNSPQAYQSWLERVVQRTRQESADEESLVFINAWNEWGEGNHLEPDRLFGHAFLEATRDALKRGQDARPLPEIEPILRRLAKDAAAERQEIAQAIGEQNAAQAELAAVLASTSWRITAPLRAARHFPRQLWRLWVVLNGLRQRLGGWGPLARKVWAVLHSQRLYSPRLLLGKLRSIATRYGSQPVEERVDGYQDWTTAQQEWRAAQCRTELASLSQHADAPTISLLMPVYNSSPVWLAEAIDSVIAQHYGKWELCIADDASTDAEIKRLLQRYAAADSRIKLVFREQNGHISAASQSALDLATGDYVAFLDHDDLLTPDALFWMARAVVSQPASGLLYSDEDRLGADGRLARPYCKPDWNPELLRAQNYLCHLTMIRTSLAREVGGFRQGFEGSQDYDLFLRVSERLSADHIVHVPLILYHWREHGGSTSAGGDAKPYALDAGKRAVQEHLQRLGMSGAVVEAAPEASCWNRVRYPLPARLPKVSLIIPTRNRLSLLRQCLESLALLNYPDYEVLVINNGSDEPDTLSYLDTLRQRPGYQVLDDAGPFNYARLNNDAVQHASGEILVFLNNDIEGIGGDWLTELVSHAVQPEVGAVGARLWFPNETLQHGGVILGIFGIASHAHYGLGRGDPGYFGRAALAQNFVAVTGACLAIRRELFERLGGFDSQLEISLNDVDLCLRAGQLGYRTVWTPYADLYHHESATRGHDNTDAKRAKTEREFAFFRNRWGGLLWADPAYNINLTLERCDCSLADVPRYEAWFKPL